MLQKLLLKMSDHLALLHGDFRCMYAATCKVAMTAAATVISEKVF